MWWRGRVAEVMPECLAEGTDVLSKEEALNVFLYMSAAFERHVGDGNDVCSVKVFTEFQRSWPGRKLQSACTSSRVNASDVFWSFVSEWSCLNPDRVKCVLKRPGGMVMWERLARQQSGWSVSRGVPRVSQFVMFAAQIEQYMRCWWKYESGRSTGVMYMEREDILMFQRNYSSKEHGMADGFWAVILWLAIKGKIVGDVERVMSGGRVASLDDVRRQAQSLLDADHINDSEYHMLAATPGSKWELKSPPMPIPGQLFVVDLFCGYMSAWYGWLEMRAKEEHGDAFIELYDADRACNYYDRPKVTGVHPLCHVGYLCNDYRPRMWSGTKHGWLKPHFTFDWASDAHQLPVQDLVKAAGLSIDHAMLALICAPCRTHSVSNYANVGNGTAYGNYKAMEGETEVTKVCSFAARERPMVQKILETTITLSKQSGFGVVVENPCSKTGPTVGSFFQVYADLVEELHLNLVCHCAWMVEWQKSTGIATSFEWLPVGRPGSEGKCICEKAHKYMIHGPAERRPRVPGVAYHAAVCALPRGMLEEIYCAFEAREAAAIQRWDEASVVEKIRAVSMQIDGCPQSMLDCPVPNELLMVRESTAVEDLQSVPVLGTALGGAVNPAGPSRFTGMEPQLAVRFRKKQLSVKSLREIRRNTAAEAEGVQRSTLSALPAAPAEAITDLMELDCTEAPDDWSTQCSTKAVSSATQCSTRAVSGATQCSTRAVSSATQCSTRAVSGATQLSDLVKLDCPDGEVNGCDAYGVAGMSDESHERLYVPANIVADHPLCANGHPMITTDYAGPGYVSGYVCDDCTGRWSEGHLGWTRERWHCGECTHDVCFQCIPQRFTDEENVDMMWT
jgi:hypothetical protein